MSIFRRLIPRPARIIRHPFGYARRRATPRMLKTARHPISSSVGRSIARKRRRR